MTALVNMGLSALGACRRPAHDRRMSRSLRDRQRWRDLTPGQKTALAASAVVQSGHPAEADKLDQR